MSLFEGLASVEIVIHTTDTWQPLPNFEERLLLFCPDICARERGKQGGQRLRR